MADASKLHGVVLGSGPTDRWTSRDYAEAANVERAFRFWVHRCSAINASVAASVPYKLVSIPDTPDSARAMRSAASAGRSVIRPLTKGVRDMLQGRGELPAPWSWSQKSSRYAVDDMVEVERHPLLDLLASANRWLDGYALMEGIAYDLQLSGTAYLFVTKAGNRPTELTRVMPYSMRPKPDPKEFVSGFEYKQGAETRQFEPDEVVWIRRFDPTNPWGGVGELQAWGDYSDAAANIAAYNALLMDRNGAPDYVVTNADGMTEDERRSFRSKWRALFGRLTRRRETVSFMSGGAKLERLSQTNRELEFNSSSAQVRDFIAAGFGVPKAMVTTEDVNKANAKEATDQHLRLTVWPMVCRIFDALNEQLVPLFGGSMMLVPVNPIRGDAAERIAERSSRLDSGSTVNEVRAEEGLEPLDMPEADVPLVAAGRTPLDKLGVDPLSHLLRPTETPQEDEGAEDDSEGVEAPEDAGDADDGAEATVEERAVRTARSWHSACGCPPVPKTGRVAWSKLWMPEPPRDLRAYRKRNADQSIIGRIVGALSPGLEELKRDLRERATDASSPGDLVGLFTRADLERASERIAEAIEEALDSYVSLSGQQAANELGAAGFRFSPDSEGVRRFVSESAERIADTAARSYASAVESRLTSALGADELDEVLDAIIDGQEVENYISDRIARTEAKLAQSFSRDEAWRQSGVVTGKRFILSSDPCSLCVAAASALEGVVTPVGEAMFAEGSELTAGDGRTIVFDYHKGGLPGPPVHPNCKCRMEPVLLGE